MPSIRELSRPLLEKQLDHKLYLNFVQCYVVVKSNSAQLIAQLTSYYKDFVSVAYARAHIEVIAVETPALSLNLDYTVKQPDVGKTKIKEEFIDLTDGRVIRKRLTDMIFLIGDGINLAAGPCEKNDNQVVNFINNRFIERVLQQGYLLGHAAGVDCQGRGLCIAGFSGMGKSTLSLHLMSRGVTFVSNDRVMIGKTTSGKTTSGLEMLGVAKLPRINPGTVLNNPDLACILTPEEQQQFSQMPTKELWELEHKFDADIAKCFGEKKFILQTKMEGLVLLNWKRDGSETCIQEIDIEQRQDLLPAFMKETGLFFRPKNPENLDFSASAYIEYLKNITIIEISGGVDFIKAADACMGFLKNGKL